MEKSQLIKLRELYKHTGYTIKTDNAEIFSNKSETEEAKEFILWDDANELMYSIRINTHYDTQRKTPVAIMTTSYEMIQFISSLSNVDDFEKIMNNISSEVICDTSTVTEIVNKYKEAYKK